MSHPEKIIKSFEEKFSGTHTIKNWALEECDCEPFDVNERQTCERKIQKFLLQSHLSYLLESKKRLEGEIEWAKGIADFMRSNPKNDFLTQQIAVLEEEIKEVRLLLAGLNLK